VRVSLDEDMLLVREGPSLVAPGDWCSSAGLVTPLAGGDLVRFPYGVLEVKLQEEAPAWIEVRPWATKCVVLTLCDHHQCPMYSCCSLLSLPCLSLLSNAGCPALETRVSGVVADWLEPAAVNNMQPPASQQQLRTPLSFSKHLAYISTRPVTVFSSLLVHPTAALCAVPFSCPIAVYSSPPPLRHTQYTQGTSGPVEASPAPLYFHL
jgi:hypothetical protein